MLDYIMEQQEDLIVELPVTETYSVEFNITQVKKVLLTLDTSQVRDRMLECLKLKMDLNIIITYLEGLIGREKAKKEKYENYQYARLKGKTVGYMYQKANEDSKFNLSATELKKAPSDTLVKAHVKIKNNFHEMKLNLVELETNLNFAIRFRQDIDSIQNILQSVNADIRSQNK